MNKSVLFCFFLVLGIFITLQNFVIAKLDKTEMPMISNEFKTERYQRKQNIKKKT